MKEYWKLYIFIWSLIIFIFGYIICMCKKKSRPTQNIEIKRQLSVDSKALSLAIK